MTYDFCVIGGGIVGLATAMRLLEMRPGASLVLVEKETALAKHQSGHNSGVIHAGVYYAPGSLKADLCKRGAEATKAFCLEHSIRFDVCGKLLVALNNTELLRMDTLEERARHNGLRIERLDAHELRHCEPNIVGQGALLVGSTAIVDYQAVCNAMSSVIVRAGGEICFGHTICSIRESGNHVMVASHNSSWIAKKLVVCAGLQSDRLATMAGLKIDHQIVPFRGEYYRLSSQKNEVVKHLIYPVPDPDLPFLGIHLTRMIDGSVTVGPNAVLGFACYVDSLMILIKAMSFNVITTELSKIYLGIQAVVLYSLAGIPFILVAVGTLVVLKVATTVMLALGPLFIAFAMFSQTRQWFLGWVSLVAGFMLTQVLFAIVLALEISFINSVIVKDGTIDVSLSGNIAMLIYFASFTVLATELPGYAATIMGGAPVGASGLGNILSKGTGAGAAIQAARGVNKGIAKLSEWRGRNKIK